LFYTTAFINDYNQTNTLINNSLIAYALINKQLVHKLNLPLLETAPRQLQGVQDAEEENRIITHVTTFSLDVSAHKIQKVFAYVVLRQLEELILGRL
jgi:hypothetical protein